MAKDTSKVLITIISEIKVRIPHEIDSMDDPYYEKFMPFGQVVFTSHHLARAKRMRPNGDPEQEWLEEHLIHKPLIPQCLYTFEPVRTYCNQKSVIIRLNTKITGMPYVCAQLASGTVPEGDKLHHLVDSSNSKVLPEFDDDSWRLAQDLAFPQISLDNLRPIVRHRVVYAND